jgi:hypothetical protein
MIARPVSFGMAYHNETVYEGDTFKGTMKFYADGTMVNSNTNFKEEMESRYYYKGGYVFFTLAQTDEAYDEEVAFINKNFDEATKMPFYADEINAFKLVVTEGDGYETVYTCTPAIVFAIIGGVCAAALIGATCVSLILFKKKTNCTDEITDTEACEK